METPISPEQQKPNPLGRIFRKKLSQPEIKTAKTEALKAEERQLNIGTNFIELLKAKGAIIPAEKEFDPSIGVSSLGGTNETLDDKLIEKVRSQQESPDGYITGIGVGNVVRMLELFPEGKMPKAMILFDIDPNVVYEGKKAIEKLKDSTSEKYNPYAPKPNSAFQITTFDSEKGERLKHMLEQLAKEGNLVIERADFTDLRLTDMLNELPDLHSSNNVIYLSNISDHIMRNIRRQNAGRGNEYEYIPDFNYLYRLTPTKPKKNYYIDTVQSSLSYHLRIGTGIPQFEREDFERRDRDLFGPKLPPIKPLDQIE